MSQIQVNHLSFGYEGSYDMIFENVSFTLDTDWKLGFIGRNGKGKTTFLKLLQKQYAFEGVISMKTRVSYFPYRITEKWSKEAAIDFLPSMKPECEEWRVICELEQMHADVSLLYRPFETLSHGERTKVLLAILFSGENEFLLIDEPTNHLDQSSREQVKEYLRGKKGFILVSHDRDLLDACIDHVLVLNRKSIEIQAGNFSTWWENKKRKDQFCIAQNEKALGEIAAYKRAAEKAARWAEKNERSKIGFDPKKEHDRCIDTRAYIGAKTKTMNRRVKQYERKMEKRIEEKEGLLNDLEETCALKLYPMKYYKERLVYAKHARLQYGEHLAAGDVNLEIMQGERVFLSGENGCGKSTIIKAILKSLAEQQGNARAFFDTQKEMATSKDSDTQKEMATSKDSDTQKEMATSTDTDTRSGIESSAFAEAIPTICAGELHAKKNLLVSYVSQNTDHLQGSLKNFCRERNLDESRFLSMLRQLDFDRVQFEKNMEEYSSGQKKKVLLAASLMTPAHLYIWDEPMNYVDVFSRMQLEEMILAFQPTMLVVDHDVRFREQIATRVIRLQGRGSQGDAS